MKLFADTSGLFASLVRNDHNHEAARSVMDAVLDRSDTLVATSFVLLETIALLQRRVGVDAAKQFEHTVRPYLMIEWVDEDLYTRAFRRLDLRGARRVSLVDCASFVVMEQLGIRSAFGFDPHFEREGFALVRRPEDLS